MTSRATGGWGDGGQRRIRDKRMKGRNEVGAGVHRAVRCNTLATAASYGVTPQENELYVSRRRT